MKKIIVIITIALIVFTISGCKTEKTETGIVVKESTALDNDLQNLETTNQDLNTSDLDNLDQDLQNVNW
jgi:hypothetical protein